MNEELSKLREELLNATSEVSVGALVGPNGVMVGPNGVMVGTGRKACEPKITFPLIKAMIAVIEAQAKIIDELDERTRFH